MTLKQLQTFLDVAKWKDSERMQTDMCGRYARCRYCTRTESYPCARAHNRLIEVQAQPVPDQIPAWLLPEPPVKVKFGAELAEEGLEELPDEPPEEPSDAEESSQEELLPQEAQTSASDAPSAQPAEPRLIDRARPHVIARGAKGDTRVCMLQRKLVTVNSITEEA